MKGSVKIMLSYDYSHFEIALSSEDEMDNGAVNELRKTAQRLADEAVRQYKKAKLMAEKRANGKYERTQFLHSVEQIKNKPEGERTVNEVAILKAYTDDEWESQFIYAYDYEDDYEADDDRR